MALKGRLKPVEEKKKLDFAVSEYMASYMFNKLQAII